MRAWPLLLWISAYSLTVTLSRPSQRSAETAAMAGSQVRRWRSFDPVAPRTAVARTQRNLRQDEMIIADPFHGPHRRVDLESGVAHRSSHQIPHPDQGLTRTRTRHSVHPTDHSHSARVRELLKGIKDSSMPSRRSFTRAASGKHDPGIDRKAYQRMIRLQPDIVASVDATPRGTDGCQRTNWGRGYAEGKIPGSCGVFHGKKQQDFFEDRSDLLPGTADNTAGIRYGLGVLNMDEDPAFEIFVSGFGTANMALKWNSSKPGFDNFARTANLQQPSFDSTGIAACDLNGDGLEEIYVLNTGNIGGNTDVGDHLFKRKVKTQGKTHTSPVFEDILAQDAVSSTAELAPTSLACVDLDGDGVYKVATANLNQPLQLLSLRQSNGLFTTDDIVSTAHLQSHLNISARSIVSGLILADSSHMDLFIGTEYERNCYFRNTRGTFQEISSQLGVEDSTESAWSAAVNDFNGDGLLDLVYANHEGPNRVFLQRNRSGSVGFESSLNAEPMAQTLDARAVVAADFDNDGHVEVFFNNINGRNRMFRSDHSGEWQEINLGLAAESQMHGTGAVVGDFDGDGVLELVLAHGELRKEKLSYFRVGSHASQNNYLRVIPKTSQGAPARGSRVVIWYNDPVEGPQVRVRIIDGGSGLWSVSEPVAHFGLGPVSSVVRLRVTFPGGVVQEVISPRINAAIEIRRAHNAH